MDNIAPKLAEHEFRDSWRTLAGCTLAAAIGTIGFSAYTSGAFVPELVAHAGYTREQLSLATLVLSGTVAVAAPFAGQVIDKWGAKRVIACAVAGEAVAFALLGTLPAQFQLYLFGIVVLALLGVGTTPPGFARIVAARFNAHRGLALGLMICGLGLMAITAPIVMTPLLARIGWRGGYYVMAAIVLAFGGGGLWLMRLDPPLPEVNRSVEAGPQGLGSWAALRRPLFWYLLACFAAPALFGGGYLLHLITILRERGFRPDQAAQIQSLIGVAILVGRFTSGAAMDRMFAPHVAAIAFAISGAGCALLLGATSGPLLAAAALAIGLTIGAELDILAYTMSRYFGLASFGRLYSLAYSVMIFAGGASPLLIAKLAVGDDYGPALMVSTVGTLAAAAAVAMLPKFQVAARQSLADPRSLATR